VVEAACDMPMTAIFGTPMIADTVLLFAALIL
jgi:hypothetical protein